MRRGDRVNVRAYPNKLLEKVVWDEYKTYILVCRPEVYSSAILLGMYPNTIMGFPREDVFLVVDTDYHKACG